MEPRATLTPPIGPAFAAGTGWRPVRRRPHGGRWLVRLPLVGVLFLGFATLLSGVASAAQTVPGAPSSSAARALTEAGPLGPGTTTPARQPQQNEATGPAPRSQATGTSTSPSTPRTTTPVPIDSPAAPLMGPGTSGAPPVPPVGGPLAAGQRDPGTAAPPTTSPGRPRAHETASPAGAEPWSPPTPAEAGSTTLTLPDPGGLSLEGTTATPQAPFSSGATGDSPGQPVEPVALPMPAPGRHPTFASPGGARPGGSMSATAVGLPACGRIAGPVIPEMACALSEPSEAAAGSIGSRATLPTGPLHALVVLLSVTGQSRLTATVPLPAQETDAAAPERPPVGDSGMRALLHESRAGATPGRDRATEMACPEHGTEFEDSPAPQARDLCAPAHARCLGGPLPPAARSGSPPPGMPPGPTTTVSTVTGMGTSAHSSGADHPRCTLNNWGHSAPAPPVALTSTGVDGFVSAEPGRPGARPD